MEEVARELRLKITGGISCSNLSSLEQHKNIILKDLEEAKGMFVRLSAT